MLQSQRDLSDAGAARSRRETLIAAWRQVRALAERMQQIVESPDQPRDPYDWLSERWASRLSALGDEWQRELIDAEAQRWRTRYPNLSLDSDRLVDEVRQRYGYDWFDPDVLGAELECAYGSRATALSWRALVEQARWLTPYHATPADLVRNQETLTLRCWSGRKRPMVE
jgi:hypothetical protein